jgi:hypothetical protein
MLVKKKRIFEYEGRPRIDEFATQKPEYKMPKSRVEAYRASCWLAKRDHPGLMADRARLQSPGPQYRLIVRRTRIST